MALNINENIYEQTKLNKILNKIFSENYLLFLEKYILKEKE